MHEDGPRRTITVGPLDIYFTNVNKPMGLRAHSHTATLEVTYLTLARHGYPSFEVTNRALLERVRELTRTPFKDATNEDVADRLWAHLDGYVAPEWERWGGAYTLHAIRLGVIGVHDDIGHDDSTTYYTVERT